MNFCKQNPNTLLAETCAFDAQIEKYMVSKELWSGDEFAHRIEISESYRDRVNMTLLCFDSMLDQPVVKANLQHLFAEHSSTLPKWNNPQVKFFKFYGRPEKYRRFIDYLESILNKFKLTSFERYAYLFHQASGPARSLLQSLPYVSLNYEAAKALLESAFSDKTLQQFSVIKGVPSLKLYSTEDFFTWISEVRQ